MIRSRSSDSDTGQASSSTKRFKHEHTQASLSAAQRFFNTAELVQHLLDYFSRDRVDLLALSLVSRTLRIQALNVWARELDVPLESAPDRLKLFQANPSLCGAVRFLRLPNNIYSNEEYNHSCNLMASPAWWDSLNQLLKMLVENSNPSRALPLIDIVVRLGDPLDLPAALAKRIVALRVFLLPNPPRDTYGYESSQTDSSSSLSTDTSSSDGTDYNGSSWDLQIGLDTTSEDDVGAASSQTESTFSTDSSESGSEDDLGSEHAVVHDDKRAAQRKQDWERLTEIILQTEQGPGLHTFHLQEAEEVTYSSAQMMEHVWRAIIQHGSTLRGLSITVDQRRLPIAILPDLKFDQLENLHIRANHSGVIEGFMDRAANIRKLDVSSTQAFSLQTTFPNLRWLGLPWRRLEKEQKRDFAQRHPDVIGQGRYLYLPYSLSTWPELVYANILKPESLERHVEAGRPLIHICLRDMEPCWMIARQTCSIICAEL